MAEPAAASGLPTQNRWDLLEVLRRLAGLLAVPATFYAVGYLIVFAYVLSTSLQAWFWFTEAFYREAGATFLLDVLMSVALLPHVFVTLSALLIVLFPGRAVPGRGPFGDWLRRWLFLGLIAASVGFATLLLQTDCQGWICWPPRALYAGTWVFGEHLMDSYFMRRPDMPRGTLFIALAAPALVALAVLTLRAWLARLHVRSSGEDQAARVAPQLASPMSLLLLSSTLAVVSVVVPVGYGARFFDLVAASVANPQQCIETDREQTPSVTVLSCFLLGKFGTHYVLVGRDLRFGTDTASVLPEEAAWAQRIYVKQVDTLNPFTILATAVKPVRQIMKLRGSNGPADAEPP